MTNRERVLKAVQCEAVDRIPWVPFSGCHSGALIGATATEILQSEDLLVKGADAAVERYRPDGIPVTFDLQIEAEALGCELTWADENPPAVSQHPLANGTRLEDLRIPDRADARIGPTLAAAQRIRKAHPDIALYGLITGPFTLALHLYGTNLFMAMFDDPDLIHRLMTFCRDVGKTMATWYLDAGVDIVAVVDPMTSQIGPDQFQEFVEPYMAPIFSSVREKGGLSSFFVCGHAQQNVEAMCDCKPDNISVDENIPLDFVRDICVPRKVSFGGNMQLTSVLLLGDRDDAQRNALECMEIAGETGFVLAPGCDLPYKTPPANLEAVGEVVRDEYQRQVARTRVSEKKPEQLLDLKEYGYAEKVIVDIVTLDSEACAPCQYMVESVKAVTPEFEGLVEWREHKIKYRESLVFMTSLMVRNVPTICIDGQISFVSRIPSRDQLIAAIQKRINEKLRIRIGSRKATLFLLGPDSEAMTKAEKAAQTAIEELGADVELVRTRDESDIRMHGYLPSQCPAFVLGRYQLKSSRHVPSPAIIKEWLKEV
jgi:MtaA/CmuA family methyltransferase